jgi:hypothetical protein
MSSPTGDFLLFLDSMRYRRGQPVYEGIDLTPWAEHHPDEWSGWVAAGGGTPEAVKVVKPQTSIQHVSGAEGSYWLIDGERIPEMKPIDRDRARVETRTDVCFSPPRAVPLPAFVARRQSLAPRQHAAVVRLADTSLAAFADAFLDQEVMDKAALHNDPGLREIMGEDFIRSCEARHAKYWEELRATTVALGTRIPAEVVWGEAATGCVVRLDHPADGAGAEVFECTLFVAEDTRVSPGTVLRRRSGLWPQDGPPRRLQRVVGTVVSVGPAQPLSSVVPAPASKTAEASVKGVRLKCLSCGATHPPERFTAEEMEVAELTSNWHDVFKELGLLRRTAELYRRHPDARRYVVPAPIAIMHSDDPAVREQLFNNVPFGRINPPRPADYDARVAEWFADDPELREYLETSHFDLDARTAGARESERKYRDLLRGRAVQCPACGDGLVALRDNDYRLP